MPSLVHSEVTIAASATSLTASTSSPTLSAASRDIGKEGAIAIVPLAANTGTVYIGGSGVTTATGYPIPATGISLDNSDLGSVYLIGTAADKVRILAVDMT